MKKIRYFIILLIFIFPVIVKANSISNIDMNIYIDKNGTAHVTETWSANLNQGTEGYKPYYNLGNARITNFNVKDNGKEYQYLYNWNTSGTLKDKAYKSGINYISNGLELCWGISTYGYHNYVLTYDIEGFVATLTDADMVYWTLIPHELSSKPSNVHIKIYSDERYKDTLDVWGYGNYGGTAYVYDGYIEMNSEGTLQSNEYMTILVKFDKGTFNTYNSINNNFEHYLDMAEEGATKYKENSFNSVFDFMSLFFSLFWFILVFYSAFRITKISNNKIGTKVLEFGKDGRKLPKDIPNYRDIPFNKNIFRAFWVSESYKLGKNKTDFLGAILLKWLKENKISLIKEEAGVLFKKEETIIDMTKPVTFDNEPEQSLFTMMHSASKDGLLESNEFKKYCNKNYKEILNWFDMVLDYETNNLVLEGRVSEKENATFNVFKSKIYNVDEALKGQAIKLKGLKNFLEEFSRINDKEAIEVHLWEYYLIYAQILGIADKVAKQFEKLYPEILENNEYGYSYNDFVFIRSISYSAVSTAKTSKARAESYSSGGGGFSSGGGGGGSFGGGSGGGGFR